MNGYITTNPFAPQSQQPFFTPYEDSPYAAASAAAEEEAAAAEKMALPPPPPIIEEEKPAAMLPAPVNPAKDRRRGLTFWSLIV